MSKLGSSSSVEIAKTEILLRPQPVQTEDVEHRVEFAGSQDVVQPVLVAREVHDVRRQEVVFARIQRPHVVVQDRGRQFVVDPGPRVVGAFDEAGYHARDLTMARGGFEDRRGFVRLGGFLGDQARRRAAQQASRAADRTTAALWLACLFFVLVILVRVV